MPFSHPSAAWPASLQAGMPLSVALPSASVHHAVSNCCVGHPARVPQQEAACHNCQLTTTSPLCRTAMSPTCPESPSMTHRNSGVKAMLPAEKFLNCHKPCTKKGTDSRACRSRQRLRVPSCFQVHAFSSQQTSKQHSHCWSGVHVFSDSCPPLTLDGLAPFPVEM
jgi:hypothetical protein